jgi:Protein of unknown function (DUF2769)
MRGDSLSLFGHKQINVTLTYDVISNCRCASCAVQADSACAKPKIAARNEMLNDPGKMMQQMMSPGMMKNLEMVKDLKVGWGGIQGKTKEQLQQMSDKMMQNTSKEQIDSMMPKTDDMPGPYCANGAAFCKDLDFNKSCMCNACEVFKRFNLSKGKPSNYYCRDGKPK